MRFAILLAATLVADAIRLGYNPQSKWVSGVLVVIILALLYADAFEFYKRVWKQ